MQHYLDVSSLLPDDLSKYDIETTTYSDPLIGIGSVDEFSDDSMDGDYGSPIKETTTEGAHSKQTQRPRLSPELEALGHEVDVLRRATEFARMEAAAEAEAMDQELVRLAMRCIEQCVPCV